MMHLSKLVALLPLLILTACSGQTEQQPVPQPIALTDEAAGHYCQMVILEHEGPKAQMYLDGLPEPLWFSQVRDGLAYVKSPEQSADILVLYVNDMGAAVSWAEPGIDNWIRANDAYFVVGSDAVGGMGAPEIAPFSDKEKAEAFVRDHGGEIMKLADIPAEVVLAPVEHDPQTNEANE